MSKLRSNKKKASQPLEPPTESNIETRKFWPFSSPGEGLGFNIYTTDNNYKLSEISQFRHIKLYDELVEKRLRELEAESKVDDVVLSESLAHRLLVSSEHDMKKMINTLVDPTKHNP